MVTSTLRGRSLSDTSLSSRPTRSLAVCERNDSGLSRRSLSADASCLASSCHASAASATALSTLPALATIMTKFSTSLCATNLPDNEQRDTASHTSSDVVNIMFSSDYYKSPTGPSCDTRSVAALPLESEPETSSVKPYNTLSYQALRQPSGGPRCALVSTKESLTAVLESVRGQSGQLPSLYIDFKGQQLGRHGRLCLVTVFNYPENFLWIIDISVLGPEAFLTCDAGGLSLKDVLESTSIIKGIFDSRSPSDSLYNIYGVELDGVHELQLMEFVSRHPHVPFLNGLVQCVKRDIDWSQARKSSWLDQKHQGRTLFNPAYGGDEALLQNRPLSNGVISACIQDVICLPDLYRIYDQRMIPENIFKVMAATKERIRLTRTRNYQGQGQHMKLGPWNHVRQARHKPTSSSRYSRLRLPHTSFSSYTYEQSQKNSGKVQEVSIQLSGSSCY